MKSQIEISDELRREQMLGPISGWSMVWGNYIVLFSFLLLVLLAYSVKYPSHVNGFGVVAYAKSNGKAAPDNADSPLVLFLNVSGQDYALIKVGQRVSMNLGFSILNLSSRKVTATINSITMIDRKCRVTAIPEFSEDNREFLSPGVKGDVKITIKSSTLFEKIFYY